MSVQRCFLLILVTMIVPVIVFIRYSNLRLMIDATFLEGMFLALLGSTLGVAGLLSPKARQLRNIGLEIVTLAVVAILISIIIGEYFVRLR